MFVSERVVCRGETGNQCFSSSDSSIGVVDGEIVAGGCGCGCGCVCARD